MRNMLVKPPDNELDDFIPDMIIFNAGGFPAVPALLLPARGPSRRSATAPSFHAPPAP